MRPVSMTRGRPAKVFSIRCIIALLASLRRASYGPWIRAGNGSDERKARGPHRRCVRARWDYCLLVAEPKFLNDLPVSGQIRPPHVVEEPTALADHLQQPATPMVIL